MPKATVTSKATTKTEAEAEAPATVAVSAKVLAAAKATVDADAKVAAATNSRQKSWLECGQALAAEYKTLDEAKPVLKEAFTQLGKTDLLFSSYRSKILALGFPKKPEALKEAIAEGLNTIKLLKVASGKLRKSKKTKEWEVVEDTGGNQGGHNKTAPIDKVKKELALTFTTVQTSKIDEDQLAVIIAELIGDGTEIGFDLTDFITALNKQQD